MIINTAVKDWINGKSNYCGYDPVQQEINREWYYKNIRYTISKQFSFHILIHFVESLLIAVVLCSLLFSTGNDVGNLMNVVVLMGIQGVSFVFAINNLYIFECPEAAKRNYVECAVWLLFLYFATPFEVRRSVAIFSAIIAFLIFIAYPIGHALYYKNFANTFNYGDTMPTKQKKTKEKKEPADYVNISNHQKYGVKEPEGYSESEEEAKFVYGVSSNVGRAYNSDADKDDSYGCYVNPTANAAHAYYRENFNPDGTKKEDANCTSSGNRVQDQVYRNYEKYGFDDKEYYQHVGGNEYMNDPNPKYHQDIDSPTYFWVDMTRFPQGILDNAKTIVVMFLPLFHDDADEEAFKKKYRELSKVYHPDGNKDTNDNYIKALNAFKEQIDEHFREQKKS